MQAGLDGQDIVVAVALIVGPAASSFLSDLLLPQARHASSQRLMTCGLLRHGDAVNRLALIEFLLHGARFTFPGELSENFVFGVPTSLSGPALRSDFVINSGAEVVWQYRNGEIRGHALEPLHENLPDVAPRYPQIYRLLTLVDAVRAGRSRERTLAADLLRSELT